MAADAEAVRTALQSALKSAQFLAVLQGIFTEKADLDSFEEARPKEIYRAEKFAPQDYPCGEIAIGRGVKNNPEGRGHDVTFNGVIYWHVDGTEEERLEDLLSRFVRATQDYFEDKPNLLPYLGMCAVWTGDEDYSPLTQHKNVLIKSAAVAVFVRTQR